MMTSVTVAESSTIPVLLNENAVQPRPGRDELLIQVRAAGLTPTELLWYPTSHTRAGDSRVAAVPGHEFSGVVVAAGEDVGDLEIGREVFGMNDWFSDGAMAEFCVAPIFAVAPKPPRLTHAEAASVPISALTAWQGLFDHARLQAGERVLIHGGAGAVGVFAVQLARLHGAHVIATASAPQAGFVASLGAEYVIDHQACRFEDCVTEVDVVFDTVGGDTLQRSWSVLKPGGRLVTVASTAERAADERTSRAFFIVVPDQEQLSQIGDLLESGHLRPVVDTVVPLGQAGEAYLGKLPRQGRGKLVVTVSPENAVSPENTVAPENDGLMPRIGGLDSEGVSEIAATLRMLLADVFCLYMKTKNFHWHVSGRHFRDYHLLLDEQADQLFAMTDDIAERARKIGASTLHSIGDIARHQRLADNSAEHVAPLRMLGELRDDSMRLTQFLRDAHVVCEKFNDVATTSLIENWIDQTERRTWFLVETLNEI